MSPMTSPSYLLLEPEFRVNFELNFDLNCSCFVFILGGLFRFRHINSYRTRSIHSAH